MLTRIHRATIIAACVFSLGLTASIPGSAQNAAPEFSLRAVDGETVTSSGLRGEVVVLAFGASWLPLTRNLRMDMGISSLNDVVLFKHRLDASTMNRRFRIRQDDR